MRKPFPPKDRTRDKSRDKPRRDAPRTGSPREDKRDERRAPPRSGPSRAADPHRAARQDERPKPYGKPRRDEFRREAPGKKEQRHGEPRPFAARAERPERGPRTETIVKPWHGKKDFRGPDRKDDRGGARPLFRSRKGWRPPVRDRDGPVFLYGWHSVKAALENPLRKFVKILATENALHRLRDDGVVLPVEPVLVRAEEIDALVGPDAVHQGLLAEAHPLPALDISDVAGDGIVLVLDQVTDPHNVGAILRTAAAFGVTAIVVTQRHSPEMTGVLAKAASGALEYVPMVAVPNLARAIEALKKNNVFVVGLDSEGDGDIAEVPLRAPLALVIGAEGKGLRQLTRANCDQVARLELPGKIKSLNVSNATALALYVAASRVAPG